MTTYQCPICNEVMGRELAVFLAHADQHILDEVRRRHPDWVEQDGLCQKCVEYYRAQLRK